MYDHAQQKWVKSRSKPQPSITLNIKVDDPMTPNLSGNTWTPTTIRAIADTACQSCLAGINTLQKLNVEPRELTPVTTKMRSASNMDINLLGAILLHISGTDTDGIYHSTRQMTYITNHTENFYLSRAACTDLGIISQKFPSIGEASTEVAQAVSSPETTPQPQDTKLAPCGCPERRAPPPVPDLPFPATEENRHRLEEYIKNYYKSSTFNICSHQPLPYMSGPPMELMIDPNAKPVAHFKAIPVPIHYQKEVKADLDRDVRLKRIREVPPNTFTNFCHRMVVCAKKDGKPRRTIDFQELNKHASREVHHTPSPFHLARSVPHNVKKSICDNWNGYHGVRLVEKDWHYTTFTTPWGRYQYMVAPQGYIASGDAFTKRYDAITTDVRNMVKCVDDSLLWANDINQCFTQICEYITLCGMNGIILNPAKFKFAVDEVEFAGFHITKDKVHPSDKFSSAISNFPTPTNLTDVRSWFGLVNQISHAFSVADTMLPFRSLLKPGNKFEWTTDLDHAFQESKKKIVKEINKGVRIFDKSRPTCLATDWSKTGIGFWLFQKHCSCHDPKTFCCQSGWQITLVGSRFTQAAESRYAPVEGEALAVVYALDKARYFVLGCPDLTIAVDHKPLLKLFGDRALEDIPNSRLRNLKEKTLRYRFRMTHIPGIKHHVADGLSRHPVKCIESSNQPESTATLTHSHPHSDIEECTQIAALAILQSAPITAVTWDLVRTATASDETLNNLLQVIENGFPEMTSELPHNLHSYYPLRDQLSTVDGVILYNDRVLIPPPLRPNVLSTLHSAHQGTSTMTSRAESSVFWPGITRDIKNIRDNCNQCHRNAPSNPGAPPTPPTLPVYPFQCICADYFTYKGVSYLVIVDRYSGWPIIEKAGNGAAGLVDKLRATFNTFGIPEELASDGGPEFTASATGTYLREIGTHHRLSSVAFAHSNCRAELGVKTVKRLLTDNVGPNGNLNNNAFHRALLQYKNTPDRDTKLSPAMCVFGHQIRDFIPVLPHKYAPHRSWRDTLEAREDALRSRHIRAHERLSEHTKRLPPLKIGDRVRIQNQTGPHPLKWDKTGSIIEVRQFDQYLVKVDGSNRTTLRNRKFLRKFNPVQMNPPPRTIMEDLILLPPQPRATVVSNPPIPTATPASRERDDEYPLTPSHNTSPNMIEEPSSPTRLESPVPVDNQLQNQETPALSPRRSTRIKQRPVYLNNYVCATQITNRPRK